MLHRDGRCLSTHVQHVHREHKGDEDAAQQLVIDACSHGGVVKYLQLMASLHTVQAPMQLVSDACDRYYPQVMQAVVTLHLASMS